jgi:hypothetical protein
VLPESGRALEKSVVGIQHGAFDLDLSRVYRTGFKTKGERKVLSGRFTETGGTSKRDGQGVKS